MTSETTGQTGTAAAGATVAERLRDELGRRCVRGLADAGRAMAGADPGPVCAAFDEWRLSEGRRAWPWLAGLCFAALEPIGVSFPDDDADAVVVGRLLVGAETDADRVRAALAALEHRVAAWASPSSSADAALEVRRRALMAAVDRFWDELTDASERLRIGVVALDRRRADAVVVATRRQLEDTAERIEAAAQRLASVLPLGPPPAPTAEPDDDPPSASTGLLEPEGLAAFEPPVDDEPAPQEFEYRRIVEHKMAPVLFLVAVTLGAILWLLVIASGGS